MLGKSTASDGGSLNCVLVLFMTFLSILLKLLSGTPLYYSLQKGLLALTSAGAKHLTVIEHQPLDPSQWNFGLFLEKTSSNGLWKRIFPAEVFEQEKS